jgi:cysteine synthase A
MLAEGKVASGSHRIQGGGYSMRPPLWRDGLADGFLAVTDEEAARWTRELARTEGIFGGWSTGANLAGAMELVERQGARVAFLVNDTGLKYLSTDLWPA